jgi:hypothetical protein
MFWVTHVLSFITTIHPEIPETQAKSFQIIPKCCLINITSHSLSLHSSFETPNPACCHSPPPKTRQSGNRPFLNHTFSSHSPNQGGVGPFVRLYITLQTPQLSINSLKSFRAESCIRALQPSLKLSLYRMGTHIMCATLFWRMFEGFSKVGIICTK